MSPELPRSTGPAAGCLRALRLFFAILPALLAAPLPAAAPARFARVRVFQAACSQADPATVCQAVAGASALLQQHCALSLSVTGWVVLALDSGWCALPAEKEARRARIIELAQAAKAVHPEELALFLLPSSADGRYSWALVDKSRQSACDSPQDARFLARFGSLFFPDLTWMLSSAQPEAGHAFSRSALLVAHEVLHALTQRGHPSGAAPGDVMADHVADLGPALPPDWCACARRSPYTLAVP